MLQDWKLSFTLFAVMVIVAMTPCLTFAGNNTPIGDIFCTISNWCTGNTGKGLTTIAVINIGIWKLLGKISGPTALIACAGIALVFGASGIIDAMDTGAEAGCATN